MNYCHCYRYRVPSRWSKSITLEFPKRFALTCTISFLRGGVRRTRYPRGFLPFERIVAEGFRTQYFVSRLFTAIIVGFFFLFQRLHIIVHSLLYLLHCADRRRNGTRKQGGPLHENRNELPSRSREQFVSVLADLVSRSLMHFILYVILINEGGSSRVPNGS